MIDRRPDRTSALLVLTSVVLLAGPVIAACGKKGPPLPPLRLVPAPVSEISARRTPDQVQLRFVLPTTNQDGPGPVELGGVEVYAMTIAPDAAAPANAELLTKAYLVGRIPARPAPRETDEPAAAAPPDDRPGPGDRVTFVEELTPDKYKPAARQPAARSPAQSGTPAAPSQASPGAADTPSGPPGAQQAPAASAAAPGVVDPHPSRIYVIRGVTAGGRPGAAGGRVAVSLEPPPLPPTALAARFTEQAVVLDWVPPVAQPGGPVYTFNVYRVDADQSPLNSTPVAASEFEHSPIIFEQEQCFAVRTVVTARDVPLESASSDPRCVTPRDIFPPAAPAGLQAVAAADAIELSWNANTESDLAGYVVLRGEAPGDTLQPLMTTPTRETTWRDTTASSGVRYVYAVVAVDKATPPNASPQSARQEVTAR